MFQCELCGEPTDQKIFRTIEGVKMLVCRNCMMMGEKPQYEKNSPPTPQKTPKYYLEKPDYPPRKRASEIKKSKSAPRGPKNVSVDRLELVENYRNILKKIRRDHDLDQGDFANSVGITHTSYKHIESGRLELTIQEARRIEKKYDVVLTEFIADQEEDEYDQYLRGRTSDATLGDVYVKRKK